MAQQRQAYQRVLLYIAALFLLAILSATDFLVLLPHRPIHIHDNFEIEHLNSIWIAQRMVPGSFSIQSKIVHSGHSAGQITLHANDRTEQASQDGAASERDELMENPRFWSHSGKTYQYAFSLYIPIDFPIVKQRLVLAQWKQLCEWTSCLPDNPLLAIRYVDGILYVTRKNDSGEQIMYQSQGEMRGKWLTFRFVNRFSPTTDGIIDGWINGQEIIRFRGVTAYSAAWGYPRNGIYYFKMGLYRDRMQLPMTIYVDDFHKDQCETAMCE